MVIQHQNNLKTVQFQIDPHNTKLCDYLLSVYLLPILQKNTEIRNVAQGSMDKKRLSPEEELTRILGFGLPPGKSSSVIETGTKKVAQGGLNTKDAQDLDRLLAFGTGVDKRNKRS